MKKSEPTKTFKWSKEQAITILNAFSACRTSYGTNGRQDEIAEKLLEKYPEIRGMDG